jgi:hypothetical protein
MDRKSQIEQGARLAVTSGSNFNKPPPTIWILGNEYSIVILSLLVFCVTSISAAPAGYKGSVENVEASLKVTKELVGTWQTPNGPIEFRADGTIHSATGDALWRVDANPHATDFFIFKYENGKEVELHDYKVMAHSKTELTFVERGGDASSRQTWTRRTKQTTNNTNPQKYVGLTYGPNSPECFQMTPSPIEKNYAFVNAHHDNVKMVWLVWVTDKNHWKVMAVLVLPSLDKNDFVDYVANGIVAIFSSNNTEGRIPAKRAWKINLGVNEFESISADGITTALGD